MRNGGKEGMSYLGDFGEVHRKFLSKMGKGCQCPFGILKWQQAKNGLEYQHFATRGRDVGEATA